MTHVCKHKNLFWGSHSSKGCVLLHLEVTAIIAHLPQTKKRNKPKYMFLYAFVCVCICQGCVPGTNWVTQGVRFVCLIVSGKRIKSSCVGFTESDAYLAVRCFLPLAKRHDSHVAGRALLVCLSLNHLSNIFD